MEGKEVLTLSDLFGSNESGIKMSGFLDVFDQILVSKRMFWGKPKESFLKKRAMQVLGRLNQIFPSHKYVVVYDFDPKTDNDSKFSLFKKWSAGRIEVRRTIDKTLGSAVALEVSDDQVKNPKFILGHENLLSIGLAEDFESLVQELKDYLQGNIWLDLTKESKDQRAKVLAEILLNHLVNEQVALRMSTHDKALNKEDISFELKKLRFLRQALGDLPVEYLTTEISNEANQIMMDLFSGLEAFEKTQVPWWEKVILFRTQSKRINQMSSELRVASLRLFLSEDEIKNKKLSYRLMVQNWLTELKKKFENSNSSQNFREFARTHVVTHQAKSDVVTQEELSLAGRNNLLSKTQFEKLKQMEQQAASVQQRTQARIESHRESLIVRDLPNLCRSFFSK